MFFKGSCLLTHSHLQCTAFEWDAKALSGCALGGQYSVRVTKLGAIIPCGRGRLAFYAVAWA